MASPGCPLGRAQLDEGRSHGEAERSWGHHRRQGAQRKKVTTVDNDVHQRRWVLGASARVGTSQCSAPYLSLVNRLSTTRPTCFPQVYVWQLFSLHQKSCLGLRVTLAVWSGMSLALWQSTPRFYN